MDELTNLKSFAFEPIPGYDDYFINRHGVVFSSKYRKSRELAVRLDKDGYNVVSLCVKGKAKNVKVHRLVAQVFIPNPDNKPQVNHIDGDKLNNKVENLEWATNGENQRHAYRVLGLPPVGMKPVRCIETGIVYESGRYAERVLGIGNNCISMAISGRSKTAGGFRWELA